MADGDPGRLPARPDGAEQGPGAERRGGPDAERRGGPDAGHRGGTGALRRGRDGRRLSAAGLASLVLHLLLLGGIVYLALHRPAPKQVRLHAAQQGVRVALVLREQKGAGRPQTAAAAAAPPHSPAPHHPAPHPVAPHPVARPQRPAPAPIAPPPIVARPDTRTAARAASPTPIVPPAVTHPVVTPSPGQPPRPAARPQPPQLQPAPPAAPAHAGFQFNLGGTNSETNAIVRGSAIVPAKPDARFRNREPIYPDAAARRGEQGAVVLLIHVAPDGRASGVDVLHSSGFRLLDRAAKDAVASWHFLPAISNGVAVAASMPLRVVFSLQ
ncbi:MAG: energy transducer TonB [Proteobacteria bacterium]|nr:energy transducer TonB [Pseudomonadota bacterium]